MNADAPAPERSVVFILSAAHSGSTWAGYVLGSHSQSAFLGEYHRAWTPHLRQPCAWCAGHGNDHCEVLHGIDSVPEAHAFEFAFSRLAKRVLVDTSKWVSWVQRFAGREDFDLAAIHLVRDPRGYYHSRRRRTPPDHWPRLIPEWLRENIEISEFLEASRVRYRRVFYGDLAEDPCRMFAGLFAFVGLPFELGALAYWEREHHGFAANGASSLMLRGLPYASQLPYLITGDDAFYTERHKSLFFDQRWASELSDAEKAAIEQNPAVVDLLRQFGRTMTLDVSTPSNGPLVGCSKPHVAATIDRV